MDNCLNGIQAFDSPYLLRRTNENIRIPQKHSGAYPVLYRTTVAPIQIEHYHLLLQVVQPRG